MKYSLTEMLKLMQGLGKHDGDIKKLANEYEETVLKPSLDVLKVPHTLKHYEAYQVGFFHGQASQKRESNLLVEAILMTVIEDKRRTVSDTAENATENITS